VLALLLGGGLALPASAQAGAGVKALAELSLEDLMRVEVVSAGREVERLADVAAPVFVITRDDIARTGVRSLPEILRLAPGVDVARLSAGRWAVGVRGDTGRFSNKLQVLVDGRSIYSPLFSGVLWETQQVPLGEIERIEIIRGPAGAVWGANAVNGVINIITRPADGGGRAARVEAGAEGSLRLGLRAGAMLDGDAGGWRAHAQVERQGASDAPEGGEARDAARAATAGLRLERRIDARTRLDLQAQIEQSRVGDTRLRQTVRPPYREAVPTRQDYDRTYLSGTLEHRQSGGSSMKLTGLLMAEQGGEAGFLQMRSRTADLEIEQAWRPEGSGHQLTWGGGLRHHRDHNESLGDGSFTPARREMNDWRLFAQDRWTSDSGRLVAVGGLRIDHTFFGGTRTQPSLALSWRPTDENLTLWSSVSRAVRVPSRGENDANVAVAVIPPGPLGNPLPVRVLASSASGQVVESVRALQLGVRRRWGEQLALDAVLFRHDYDPLSFNPVELTTPELSMLPLPHLDAALRRVPGRARVSGLELSLDWHPLPSLRQQFSAAWSRGEEFPAAAGDSTRLRERLPSRLLSWRTSIDLTPHLGLDVWVRHTAARGSVSTGTRVDSRTVVDLSTRWAVSRDVTLGLRVWSLGAAKAVEIHPDLGYSRAVLSGPGVGLHAEMIF
jgi:iron complex outermembrane receptor protein